MAEPFVPPAMEVGKCVAVPLGRQFCYVYNYSDNIKKLKAQVAAMNGRRQRLQISVDRALSREEEIFDDVKQWISGAEEKDEEVKRIIGEAKVEAKKRCFFGLFPNLKTRHHFGRMACKKITELGEFVQNGPRQEELVSHTPPRQPIPEPVPEYIPSESRSSELEEILDALKDPNVRMIGIYGMGGLGKTTLVHQVKLEVQKSDNKFDAAVIVTVKLDPDPSKIREEIAKKLGLVYEREDTEERRRELLWNKLKEKGTVLLILDDLWKSFDYHEVGIPFGEYHQGCKLLLTSRKLDVLHKIGSKNNIPIGLLKYPEDWQLFEGTVGRAIDENDELHSKAMDIVTACSGLPLSIVTMAGTLRNRRDLPDWEDALIQLRNLMHTEIGPEEIKEDDTNDDIVKVAYSTIKLSFQNLKGRELQLFFLICATTADAISTRALSIEDLIRYAKGWGLLRGIETMRQARNRVSRLIRDLKDCCLLIENDNQQQYAVHDLVRDVGILIARQEWKMLTARDVKDEKLLSECTWIFLPEIDFSELPEHLNCPQLRFFHLDPKAEDQVAPDNFFRDMRNLRVLCLTSMQFSQQLPSSIELLKELRTLCLHHCKLGNISTIGELKKLEILSLSNSEITQLPKEVGKLTQLRLLDLRYCYDLNLIPVDTISSLRKLEELYILNSFKKWEEDQNASLSELKDLRQLTALEIQVPTAKILPSNFFSMDLQQCKILIGGHWRTWKLEDESKVLKIDYKTNDDAIKQFEDTKLVEKIEVLFLENLSGVSNICNGVVREGFSQLKKLCKK